MMVTDMETWLVDNSERIYRFLVYKKMFTPYEQQMAFSDESQYEDTTFRFGVIEEAVELNNGDWVLGIREIIEYEVSNFICYYRLSEIHLEMCDKDQDMLTDDSYDEWEDEDEL